MTRERKPWETPITYNDDRFDDDAGGEMPQPAPRYREHDDGPDERDGRDVEEILRRPDAREGRDYECTDTTPIDYRRGPHDKEFGVEEREFDTPDDHPVPYDKGPHDEEFGEDDEDH